MYIYLYVPCARTPAQHTRYESSHAAPFIFRGDANPRLGEVIAFLASHHPASTCLCARDGFLLGRVRFRAKTRRRLPRLPVSDSSAHDTRVISDAGALPYARNARSRPPRRCPDAPRRVSRDDARTTKSTGRCSNAEWCERSGTLMESARRTCLVKATTSCVLPSPWVVWGRSVGAGLSTESNRARPRLAEVHLRGNPT